MHVLLVKTSSLGDIVHSLPAVEDAARQGVRFDWVAEEGYAALPRLHRSVGKVIPVAFRRWRKTPVTSLNDLFAFRRRLRLDEYDLVIDAQGLIKSALVGRWARARDYVGFDQASARERWASTCYNRRVASRPTGNAIDRLRGLFAEAIGYPVPSSEPQFGIAVDVAQEDYCVLLHGTTWDSKHWPDRFWIDVARRACALGLKPKLLWGTEFERQRARRLHQIRSRRHRASPLRRDPRPAAIVSRANRARTAPQASRAPGHYRGGGAARSCLCSPLAFSNGHRLRRPPPPLCHCAAGRCEYECLG